MELVPSPPVRLLPVMAPAAVNHFRALSRSSLYDSSLLHAIICHIQLVLRII